MLTGTFPAKRFDRAWRADSALRLRRKIRHIRRRGRRFDRTTRSRARRRGLIRARDAGVLG